MYYSGYDYRDTIVLEKHTTVLVTLGVVATDLARKCPPGIYAVGSSEAGSTGGSGGATHNPPATSSKQTRNARRALLRAPGQTQSRLQLQVGAAERA